MTARLLAAVTLVVTLLVAPSAGPAAAATAPGASPVTGRPSAALTPLLAGEQAFSDVAGCISGADNVLVSVVVDESLSLRDTDPGDLRVRGITTAIDSLDQLAASVGPDTRVHVSLSTFARSFDTLAGWQRLTPATAQRLRSAAESQLPDRDTGNATDYRQALSGARDLLDERQQALRDPDACKVLLWFTDGALDVDDQTSAAATQLCQPSGIVDAVRRDGIAVIALALFTPGAGVTPTQRDQLRAVAEGRGSGATCGTVPIPPQSTGGIYLRADDPAALAELFGTAGALVGGGTQIGELTCPGPQCPGGRYSLPVDPGVAGARVLVAARGGGTPDVRVTSPSGETVDLSSGSVDVDGATVSLIERDGFATLDVSYPSYAEDRAVWQVRPGPSRLTVFWFWGAQLQLDTESVQAGERNDLRLQLLDRTGEPLDPTLYDDFRVDAALGERAVPARMTRDGEVAGSIDLGVDRLPPSLPLRVSVTARSRPSGIELGPLTTASRVSVELPPVYPSLSPEQLDFGSLEGEGTAEAELRATGSRRGPTRVCVTGSSVTVPGQDPADLVDAGRRCVDLDTGARGTIPLRLTPQVSADGVASGDVTVRLEPSDGSAPLEVDVPVELEMHRIVDESTRWLLVAVLVGLALLLPLLVLLIANWLTATFAMTSLSRVGTAPVRVTPHGLVPRDGEELITPDHFDNAGFSGRRRERSMRLGHTGITAESRGALGLRDARGVAVGPERRLLVSSSPPYRGEHDHEAPMTLGDVDATFVVVERTGTAEETEGTLVMVVPGSVDNDGIRERAQETSNRVPWDKVLADAAPDQALSPAAPPAAIGADPGAEPAWVQDASSGDETPPSAAEREPFPWEEDPATDSAASAPPLSRKSGSWGKRRRSATDSSRQDTAEPPRAAPPRPTDDADRSTDTAGSDDSDDGLPPLPDFLKED